MYKNNINAQIPQEVAEQVVAKLKEIQNLLTPYTVSLTAEERKSLPKMGDKTLAFVSKVVEYVSTNPKFVPTMMDVEALKTDLELYQQLVPFQTLSDQISEQVKDTHIAAGHEAYAQALLFYANVKLYAKMGDAEAKVILEELSKRYVRGKKSASDTSKKEL